MHDAARLPLRLLLGGRVYLLIVLHSAVFGFAYWVGFALRFDLQTPPEMAALFWKTLPAILLIKLPIFYLWGNFHGWLRYATFSDLVALLRAVAVSFLVIVALDHYVLARTIPRSVLILDSLAVIVALGGLRSLNRLVQEGVYDPLAWKLHRGDERKAALIVADSLAGEGFARQIHSQPQLRYRVVGSLCLNRNHHGSRLGGIPVLGAPADIARAAAATRARDVLVIAGTLPGKELRALMEKCRELNLTLRMIPSMDHLLANGQKLHVRDVDINDLLRREPVQLDCSAIEQLVEGQTVLVTGAGGSIGSEICRQLLRFHPGELVLLGRGENRIFAIERELAARGDFTTLHPVIADITDQSRMRHIFERHRPHLVFHTAAHKHVPLMEANVGEAVKNNVLGTKTVADLAHEFHADGFVLISTDKAVNPTSVMGATKQLAERYIHSLSQDSQTRFMAVRFGNVLGSTGSVVPIFQEQIRNGGPITITDERMVRYFMTIPEASQLVLQAAAMGQGGEIFVLDMGDPVKIVDLARDLICLSGLPSDSIEVVFIGVRSGEKFFEELNHSDECTLPTSHSKVRVAHHRLWQMSDNGGIVADVNAISELNARAINSLLRQVLPNFSDISSESTQRPANEPPMAAFSGR